MSKGMLNLGGVTLPDEAVTETFVILGKRGSGKTTAARVMVEELLSAGLPAVVIDPTGVWWGLRSSADGRGDGHPVVIFGGDHADVPLEETAGKVIADVLVDRRIPAVLDLSALSKSAGRRLCADFLERLYMRNRDPLHLVVDEADLIAPQRTYAGVERLLGAIEDVVRRGRARGIGCTLITQRPAVLHKDVLSQAEVLVALRMTSVRDVAAIDEWVRLHADEDEARTVKASLPSLPVGTAWLWSPGWLAILQRVKVRKPTTFDSSATPTAGARRVLVKQMAPIDLDELGEQITATVERAKADDPRSLRAQITRLQRDLEKVAADRPEPVVERVEVPVLDDAAMQRLQEAIESVRASADALVQVATGVTEALNHRPVSVAVAARPTPARQPRPAERQQVKTEQSVDRDSPLGRAERRILTVLAQHGQLKTNQVAILAQYSHKSGGFRNSLSSLRTAGYITGRGDVTITDAGLAALGDFEPLPDGADLRRWWQNNVLGLAERRIVDVLADAYPNAVDAATIAEATDYSPTSGGFRNALSRLRSLELAYGRGELVLNEALT